MLPEPRFCRRPACVVAIMAACQLAQARSTQDGSPEQLTLGKPLTATIAPGAAHDYAIAIDGPQKIDLDVDQRGIDVVVSVFAPDGTSLAEVDTPTGSTGTEHVTVRATVSGTYRVHVSPLEARGGEGRYRITLTTVEPLSEPQVTAARDELTVRELEARWWAALETADVASLKALMRDDGIGLERRPELTRTRAEYLGGVMSMKARLESGDRRSTAIDARQVLVYGDTAITSGHVTVSWDTPSKRAWQESARFIHVWQRGPQGWALVMDHSYELNVPRPLARDAVTVDRAVLAMYAGRYTTDWGQRLTFMADGDTLRLGDAAARAPDAAGMLRNVGTIALTPLSDTTFQWPDGTEVTFVRSSDGRVRELILVHARGTMWARRE